MTTSLTHPANLSTLSSSTLEALARLGRHLGSSFAKRSVWNRWAEPAAPLSNSFHAARAKLSGIGNPSAINLNSTGSDTYLSAAIVVAVCEDGRPLPFCGALALLEFPTTLSSETTLSSRHREYAAD